MIEPYNYYNVSCHLARLENILEANIDHQEYHFNTANTPNTTPFPRHLTNHTLISDNPNFTAPHDLISNLTTMYEEDYLHLYALMSYYESL